MERCNSMKTAGVMKMSKLTKKERLLHSLNGIKQLFNNLGVEDLKNEIVLKDGTTETIDCYKEIETFVVDFINNEVDKATWIPVEKKRPPMFVKVLITYEDKYLNPHINVAFVDHHYEWIYPFRSKHTYRVIAWMPLPKPYLGSDKYE